MLLEKGSKENPTGNLIIYCYVKGENPFQQGHEIIASNVVVSFLKINDNYPVVTFPPVSYLSMDDLKQAIAHTGDIYDIIRVPDFNMPQEAEQSNKYMQERMEQYNQVVMRYVELCRSKEKKEVAVKFPDNYGETIEALGKLTIDFQSASGLAREVAKYKVNTLIDKIQGEFPQFDLDNYRNALFSYPGHKGEEIAALYLKKFQAIQEENYETASILKSQIETIESKFF